MVSRFSLFATIRRVRIPVEAAEQSLRRERMAEIESTKRTVAASVSVVGRINRSLDLI